MELSCPACKKRLRISDKHLGKVIACPSCSHRFRVRRAGNVDPENPPDEATDQEWLADHDLGADNWDPEIAESESWLVDQPADEEGTLSWGEAESAALPPPRRRKAAGTRSSASQKATIPSSVSSLAGMGLVLQVLAAWGWIVAPCAGLAFAMILAAAGLFESEISIQVFLLALLISLAVFSGATATGAAQIWRGTDGIVFGGALGATIAVAMINVTFLFLSGCVVVTNVRNSDAAAGLFAISAFFVPLGGMTVMKSWDRTITALDNPKWKKALDSRMELNLLFCGILAAVVILTVISIAGGPDALRAASVFAVPLILVPVAIQIQRHGLRLLKVAWQAGQSIRQNA